MAGICELRCILLCVCVIVLDRVCVCVCALLIRSGLLPWKADFTGQRGREAPCGADSYVSETLTPLRAIIPPFSYPVLDRRSLPPLCSSFIFAPVFFSAFILSPIFFICPLFIPVSIPPFSLHRQPFAGCLFFAHLLSVFALASWPRADVGSDGTTWLAEKRGRIPFASPFDIKQDSALCV